MHRGFRLLQVVESISQARYRPRLRGVRSYIQRCRSVGIVSLSPRIYTRLHFTLTVMPWAPLCKCYFNSVCGRSKAAQPTWFSSCGARCEAATWIITAQMFIDVFCRLHKAGAIFWKEKLQAGRGAAARRASRTVALERKGMEAIGYFIMYKLWFDLLRCSVTDRLTHRLHHHLIGFIIMLPITF